MIKYFTTRINCRLSCFDLRTKESSWTPRRSSNVSKEKKRKRKWDTMSSSQWNILNFARRRHEAAVFEVVFYSGKLCTVISTGRSSVHGLSPCQVMQHLFFYFFSFFCSVSADKKLHEKIQNGGGGAVSFFVPSQKIFQNKNPFRSMCDKLATWSHAGLMGRAGSCCNGPCRRETVGWVGWGPGGRGVFSRCGPRWFSGAPSHVSTGLGTILLGVSGNWDDREVTSLPDEFPREPDSEKDTWTEGGPRVR